MRTIALILPLWAVGSLAQTPSSERLVTGRVINGLSREGIPAAQVTLVTYDSAGRPAGPSASTESDANGYFKASVGFGAAKVRFQVSKQRFLQGHLAPLDYLAPTHTLTPGRTSVELRMWPTARIEGRLVTPGSEAVAGAAVELLRSVYTGLGSRWVGHRSLRARTDEHGTYRIEDVRPGKYVLTVRLPAALGNDARLFAPGTTVAAEARPFQVRSGEVIRADVVAPRERQRSRILGRVVGGEGSLADYAIVLAALDSNRRPLGYWSLVDRSAIDGSFSFNDLPAGSYQLSTFRFPATPPGAFLVGGNVQTLLTPAAPPGRELPQLPESSTWVADDVVELAPGQARLNVSLELRAAARIRGKVVFRGTETPPDPATFVTVPVVVRPADGRDLGFIPQSRVERDGTFTSIGLPSGQYVLNLLPGFGLPNWSPVSVRLDGEEILGAAVSLGTFDVTDVTVVLSSRITEVTGTVVNDRGEPAPDSSVFAFPRDRRRWSHFFVPPAAQRIVRAAVGVDASYHLTLPPGEYYVAAAAGYPAEWMTPEQLQRLVVSAVAVDLAAGENESLMLTVR